MVARFQDGQNFGLKDRRFNPQILAVNSRKRAGRWQVSWREEGESETRMTSLHFTAVRIAVESIMRDDSAVSKALVNDTKLPTARYDLSRN